MKIFTRLYVFIICIFLAGCAGPIGKKPADGTIDIFSYPYQNNIYDQIIKTDEYDGFNWTITAKAEYDISGILRSKKHYYTGWNAHFAPMDFCISWGELNKEELNKDISYSQSNRWYYWRYKRNPKLNNPFIIQRSCNAHIIPANDNIYKALNQISVGSALRLQGYLVYIYGKNKNGRWYNWHSSLTRTDTGDGSCEVFYVNKVIYNNLIYE